MWPAAPGFDRSRAEILQGFLEVDPAAVPRGYMLSDSQIRSRGGSYEVYTSAVGRDVA